MKKAGHRRLAAGIGLAVLLGLGSHARAGAAVPARASVQGASYLFDGDPEVSDFVALAVILGLSALRRRLRA